MSLLLRTFLPRLLVYGLVLVLTAVPEIAESQSPPDPQELGKLSITLAPSSLPADGRTYSALFVQLWGPEEAPRQSREPVRVFLTSSNPDVASVPSEVTIESGATYVTVPVTVSHLPGEAQITGVAVGYERHEVQFETTSQFGAKPPFHLKVTALPPFVFTGATGLLTVALVDENDIPFLAPYDIPIVLTSSAPDSISLTREITIPKGGFTAKTDWYAKKSGDISMLAQADNVTSGKADVSVSRFIERDEPSIMEAYPILPALPSDEGAYEAIVLQARDRHGNPVDFPCTDVFVTSSAPDVLGISQTTTPSPCESKQTYTAYSVTTTRETGEAIVSAGATGITPKNVTVPTYGIKETRIRLEYAPSLPVATDATPVTFSVQLVNENGSPVAHHEDYEITLLSDGAEIPSQVTIPSGDSHVAISIPHHASQEYVSITAAATGLKGDTITYFIEQEDLDISLDIPEITAGETAEIAALVTSDEEIVPQAEVQWELDGGITKSFVTATNEEGIARIFITPIEDESEINLQAFASYPGYDADSVAANLTVAPPPIIGEAGPSRTPFLLIFAMVCIVLALYLGYTSGIHHRLLAKPSLGMFRRPKTL